MDRELCGGGQFDLALRTALLDSFFGTNPNGLWGFYIADYSNGDITTLANYTVTLTMVPEPGTFALLGLGGAGLLHLYRRKR